MRRRRQRNPAPSQTTVLWWVAVAGVLWYWLSKPACAANADLGGNDFGITNPSSGWSD